MNIFMKLNNILVCLVLVFSISSVFSQESQKLVFSAMFYNVENLFDTTDNPMTQDNDFLPESKKQWNTPKYYVKLRNISRVIVAAGKWHVPDIIGLCEVETADCLWDLTHKTNLSRLEYSYIHYESLDNRGIDVALLYNPQTFTVLSSKPIRVCNETLNLKTRDILYVKGIVMSTQDTLHVFVCHFPSRMGGQAKSESKRVFAANVLRKAIDSVQSLYMNNAHILVMGDCNDGPQNRSISEVLHAGIYNKECSSCMVSVIDSTFSGTHLYKGEWNYLDQTIVSNYLYSSYILKQTIIRESFITQTTKNNSQIQPYRTYTGAYFTGGYSDHFPVLLQIFNK